MCMGKTKVAECENCQGLEGENALLLMEGYDDVV